MICKVLILVMVFADCLVGIYGDTMNRVYMTRPECDNTSGVAYFGPETETEIVQAFSDTGCASRCSRAADCNSFNYNSNNGSCHLNAGVVRKNISRLTEVANYRYYEFHEEVSNFVIITNKVVYIYISICK